MISLFALEHREFLTYNKTQKEILCPVGLHSTQATRGYFVGIVRPSTTSFVSLWNLSFPPSSPFFFSFWFFRQVLPKAKTIVFPVDKKCVCGALFQTQMGKRWKQETAHTVSNYIGFREDQFFGRRKEQESFAIIDSPLSTNRRWSTGFFPKCGTPYPSTDREKRSVGSAKGRTEKREHNRKSRKKQN